MEPHWLMEQFIGIGFIFRLYDNIYVFQEAGLGAALWGGNEYYMQKIQWEWDYTLKLGLYYRFIKSPI